MPQLPFVATDITYEDVIQDYEALRTVDKGKGKRAQLSFLAKSPLALREAYLRVTTDYIKHGPGSCITTTRAVVNKKSKYASLTFKFVAKDHPANSKENRKRNRSNSFLLRLLCHHVVMLYKQKGKVWPQFSEDGQRLVVSHDCHNNLCVKPSHLSIIPEKGNLRKSNRNCIAWVICRECKVSMLLCNDVPRCKTYMYTICSKCGGGEYVDSAGVLENGINVNPYNEQSSSSDESSSSSSDESQSPPTSKKKCKYSDSSSSSSVNSDDDLQ
jgi:hypothetical protein